MKKINPGFFTIIFVIFLFPTSSLLAQTKKAALTPHSNISAEIKTGQIHQYTIDLADQQFTFFKLVQDGVDLIIRTFDADGKKIEDFDSPNGAYGPEYFTINSGKKGVYMVEVRPLEESYRQGKYTLEFVKAEPQGTTSEKKVDQLFTAWDNQETPGAAVAVVKDGAIIYKKGYGSANLEYDIPNSPATIFHIASVSKQFTAFSIMLLAAEGKLSLDDDIRKYIPEVPDFGKTITLRHLATHTSGLRDQWNLLAMAGWRLDDVITKEHILKLVSRQKELNFNPGDEYLYCNTGFTLLAEVVARVSGQTFADFTRERIFKPLKMTNTLFYDDHEKIVKNRAYSYYGEGAGYKKSNLNYANVGATSLFTTVEDLSLWAMNFENPIVGNRQIFDQMETPGVLNNGQKIGYALGQGVGKYKGLKLISHSGGDAGYRTYLGRFPEQRFSVIVFSNDAAFNPGVISLKIADIYLKSEIAALEKAQPKTPVIPTTPQTEQKSVPVDTATLNSYAGQYELQPNFIITITEENGKLFGQATGQPKFTLIALSPARFSIKEVNAEITFQKDEGSALANRLTLNQNGSLQTAPRIKPFDEKSVDLSEYTGHFYSEELGTEYILTVEKGILVSKHIRLSDMSLRPVKTDSFASNAGDIIFIRNDKKEITGLRISNGRVRNLWFGKIK
jgi:CubicO group peptidase (beta-lactamase class C family)